MKRLKIALNIFQICFDIFVILFIIKSWKENELV